MNNLEIECGTVFSSEANMNQAINASNPEVSVIKPDGAVTGETLTPREISLFEAVDRALRADPKFVSSYPDAVLERIESLRAMPETTSGRSYLRYRFATGVTEFWGRVSGRARINYRSGIVDVMLEPDAAQPAQPQPAQPQSKPMQPAPIAPDEPTSNATEPAPPTSRREP